MHRGARTYLAERLEAPLARVRSSEHLFMIILAIALGVLGAYGAIGFRWLIQWVTRAAYGVGELTIAHVEGLPWWWRVGAPVVGGLVVGLVVHWMAPEVRGSGIPEVMESVARRGGTIRFRVVIAKAIAAAVTIGSGGSAGREGPIVHIGSAIGSVVGQIFQVPARQLRSFVACGAAAGIAATFNAPIAGALFAIEVILGDMRAASMSAIVISSVVATVISRHYLGDFPAFDVPVYTLHDARELLLYALLGVLAAGVSLIFIKTLSKLSGQFERLPVPRWSSPAIGGLIIGILALIFPHVLGVGYETINLSLWSQAGVPVWSAAGAGLLATVMIVKLVSTSVTLGSGGSGGVFAPSLFLGAALGAAFGQAVGAIFPEWAASPGAYALVGMGAVVAGTTHAPITAILIIFELTNDYHIIPPLMLSCVLSVLLTSQLFKDSIYTVKLSQKGLQLMGGRDVNLLKSITVDSVLDSDVSTITAATPLGELLPRLLGDRSPFAFVVNQDAQYIGSVELSDVSAVVLESEELASIVVAADVADTQMPFVVPGDNLDLVMHLFGKTHKAELPVCASNEDKRVVGVVNKQAVINAYNRRVFQEDLTGGFESLLGAVQDGRSVEVLGGVHMAEVDVPTTWIGKELRGANPRQKLNIEVVLIHRPVDDAAGVDGRPGLFPSPELVFQAGDRILVMGTLGAIKKLQG